MAGQVPSQEDHSQSISKSFDIYLKNCLNIEKSDLPSNNKELQKDIQSTISKLEQLTLHISYLGVFSSNETIDELSTDSIKFLMLPVLLGSLTYKLVKPEREDTLRITMAYFKDFLRRCKDYNLTEFEVGEKDFEEGSAQRPAVNARPTAEDLKRMGKQREEKIRRYKERKALGEKLISLQKAIENPSHDEDVLREYYLTLINQFIFQSIDELESISLELSMLRQMKQAKLHPEPTPVPTEPSNPLRPFLITKDAVQKKVFGAGYPSLPVMSVEEFYEQKVKDGWFPPPSQSSCSSFDYKVSKTANLKKNEESEEEKENEEENLEMLRQRDEWRDMHKRGWGNTYNRS